MNVKSVLVVGVAVAGLVVGLGVVPVGVNVVAGVSLVTLAAVLASRFGV